MNRWQKILVFSIIHIALAQFAMAAQKGIAADAVHISTKTAVDSTISATDRPGEVKTTEKQPKNPARPITTDSGIRFDLKRSTGSKNFDVVPGTTTVSQPSGSDTSSMAPVEPTITPEAPELQNARAKLQNGDWRGARRDSLSYIKTKDKKSSDAWTVLAKTYAVKKEYAKAIRRFNKALKYNPHNAEAFYGKGQAYEAEGKLDEAGNEYQAALHADAAMADAQTAWKRIKDQVSSAP